MNENENETGQAFHTPPEAAKLTGVGNLVGIACGTNCITAWCVEDGLRVNVTSQRDKEDPKIWSLTARVGEKIRMMATIFGGRWVANVYTREVRNALVSRCKRVRKTKANRRARLAEQAADAANVAEAKEA